MNHSAYKSLLFLGAGSVLHATGTRELSRLGGLWRPMPWTAGLFALGALTFLSATQDVAIDALAINSVPLDQVKFFKDNPNDFKVQTAPGGSYQYLAFNLKDPILRKKEVRQALAHAIDRERIKRRKLLLQVRNEIANSLHDDISLTLSDINVLSEIAKLKAGKNIEQSKDFIAKISEKSSNMITAMDDMLWSIDPANDSMKKTLDRLKELTYGLQVTYNAEIELMVDKKLEKLELEMKLRHDFFFLYNDAISFLVKQAYTSPIFVNMKLRKSQLLIEIITECPEDVPYFELQFRKTVQRRLQQLPATMNFTIDNNYVLAVFYIQLKS